MNKEHDILRIDITLLQARKQPIWLGRPWPNQFFLAHCYNNYPVRVYAAGLCFWSRQFVYVQYIYMWTKNGLFGVLPLESLLLV